jgi:hypothetical protein
MRRTNVDAKPFLPSFLFLLRILPRDFSDTRRPPMPDFTYCKLEIFIPETHLSVLQRALQEVDAGHIGKYDSCLSYSPVTGCWRPLDGATPYLGSIGEISAEPELKVEVTCLTARVDETVEAIKKVHPYEEPVIQVIPLYRTSFSAVPQSGKQPL